MSTWSSLALLRMFCVLVIASYSCTASMHSAQSARGSRKLMASPRSGTLGAACDLLNSPKGGPLTLCDKGLRCDRSFVPSSLVNPPSICVVDYKPVEVSGACGWVVGPGGPKQGYFARKCKVGYRCDYQDIQVNAIDAQGFCSQVGQPGKNRGVCGFSLTTKGVRTPCEKGLMCDSSLNPDSQEAFPPYQGLCTMSPLSITEAPKGKVTGSLRPSRMGI